MEENYKSSFVISYSIGGLFGFALGFGVWYIFNLKDNSISGFVIETMGWSIVSMIGGFVLALRIAAIKAHNLIADNKSLIYASFIYCLIINLLVWGAFAIGQVISDRGVTVIIQVPLIGLVVSLPFTTFTIGLLISHLIKRRIIL